MWLFRSLFIYYSSADIQDGKWMTEATVCDIVFDNN